MKRTIALLLSFVLSVLLLCSCSGQAVSPQTSTSTDSALSSELEQLRQQLADQAKLIANLLAQKENAPDDQDEPPSIESEESGENDAEGEETRSDFEYIKENGGITVTRYLGSETNVRIPERIEGLPVLKIGKHAFAESKIKNVTIPSLCESIDWFAFYGCYALSGVYVSNSTSEIGYGAFDGCSKSLTLYCPADSYALKYAKSFGIAYSVLN